MRAASFTDVLYEAMFDVAPSCEYAEQLGLRVQLIVAEKEHSTGKLTEEQDAVLTKTIVMLEKEIVERCAA